ncbi:MAG: NAD-dependent deacetylase [Gammaproteobacteria bacterium]
MLQGQARIVVLAGAGLSAASGVPTFRDAQTGHWATFRPEDLATSEAFMRDPQMVWRWYLSRRETIGQVSPNAGHDALTRWQRERDVTIITQNVDGLQQRAGGTVTEFHGNLFVDLCFEEHRVLSATEQHPGEPPRCVHCDAYVRPGVVWFGENIPTHAMREAEHAVDHCDIFVSVGTSSLVYPAAGFAEAALRRGARFIEINPEETPLSSLADHRLAEPAQIALPALVDALLSR